jgi:hypothetical protein
VRKLIGYFTLITVFLGLVWAWKAYTKPTLETYIKRIDTIRNGGLSQDGPWVLMDPLKISEDDYFLVVTDFTTTKQKHPDIQYPDLGEFRHFSAASDLKEEHVLNGHSTLVGDKWIVEEIGLWIPKPEYQASAKEIAWKHLRFRQLGGLKDKETARAAWHQVDTEAQTKPWNKLP